MTNRRRSAKGRTSTTKKSESPEKTRKLTRRSRRSKKSESPERTEEVDSDYSGADVEGDKTNDNDNENFRDGNVQSDSFKSNEEKSQLKEEESGGSDGSWKVKSENGAGTGIPKLKLCLTRPPEMPSPTSTSDQNPSPRRRKRGGRGNITPTLEEDQMIQEVIVEESSKRVTRHRGSRGITETVDEKPELPTKTHIEPESVSDTKHKQTKVEPQFETQEEEEVEVPNSTNSRFNDEEDETRLAVESICFIEQTDDNSGPLEKVGGMCYRQEPETIVQQVAETTKNEIAYESMLKPQEEKRSREVEMEEEPEAEKSEQNHEFIEKIEVQTLNSAQAQESVSELKSHSHIIQETEQNVKEKITFVKGKSEVQKTDEVKDTEEVKEVQDIDKLEQFNEKEEDQGREQKQDKEAEKVTVEEKAEGVQEIQETTAFQAAESTSQEQPEVVVEKRRSSSRDSSEERAKEAALRSRNKNRRREGSEEGEVIESPRPEINRRTRSYGQAKASADMSKDGDRKENLEDSFQAKSGARKRRWGSSTAKTSKKQSVSISTDFLKEIIPEVKPLPMSEVQLSPNEEDEEGQLKDSEESLPVVAKGVERSKVVQSDESEKDYEEEAMESGADEACPREADTLKPVVPTVKEKEYTAFTRKVSMVSANDKLQKSPSPARHKPTNILFIMNLVRPFTVPQLRELLARTGTIAENGFWIDKIKSKCYVKYETENEAKTTRHALHGVRWPVSNPKQLNVDFGTEAAMKAAMEGNEINTKRPIPSLFDKQIDLKMSEKSREREKEREKASEKRERSDRDKRDRGKHREDDKKEEIEEDKDKKARPPVEPLVRDRTVRRVTMPVREWDVGKNEDGFSPPPDGMEFSRHRDDRYDRRVEYDREKRDEYDDRRRRDKERGRRSVSGEPPRKSKKKNEEETPAKLLDDLFRKTKATPCIYWLPLTPEQIAVKEEMRRKHMAEHEKKVAELRKMQREQSKRGSEKRRRRTKSRSRSRSVKK